MPPSFNYNVETDPVPFLKGRKGWSGARVRRKDRKRVGGYLFLLLLKTSITCFRVTCAVPSRDPINLGAELLSALSGTLISACDEGEGGQLIYYFFSSQRWRESCQRSPQSGGCNSIFLWKSQDKIQPGSGSVCWREERHNSGRVSDNDCTSWYWCLGWKPLKASWSSIYLTRLSD